MDSLRSLALELDLPERTVRRAAREGLIRGERTGERGFRTTLREREYLRRHWPLLSGLREALRTEPSVAMAVLYGSHANGTETESSDIDLLVDLRSNDPRRLTDISRRLTDSIGRDVHPVRLEDADSSASLFLDVLRDGRVLVDREGRWEKLRGREPALRRRARAEPSLDEVADGLLDGESL